MIKIQKLKSFLAISTLSYDIIFLYFINPVYFLKLMIKKKGVQQLQYGAKYAYFLYLSSIRICYEETVASEKNLCPLLQFRLLKSI